MTSLLKQLLEEEEVQVPVAKESDKEPAKMETDEIPADPAPCAADVNMEDSKTDVPATENGVPESGVQMETDVKVTQMLIIKICYFYSKYIIVVIVSIIIIIFIIILLFSIK